MINYKYYDEKYANLLVNKCLINNGVKPLVIIYDGDELDTFAKTCYMQAKKSGCNNVILYNFRFKEANQQLANTNLEDIVLNDLIDRSILEDYAKKGSNLLFLEAYHDNIYIDVDVEKRQKASSLIENQLDIYYKNIYNHKCPWCLACYPTLDWARKVYPNMDIDKAQAHQIDPAQLLHVPEILRTDRTGRRFYDCGLPDPLKGEQIPYWYAFWETPHTSGYGPDEFRKVNSVLFPEGADGLEVYEWTTDWSNYFEAGREWWGTACWSVYDQRMNRYVVIMADTTD